MTSCCNSVVSCDSGLPCDFAIGSFWSSKRTDKGAVPALLRVLASDKWWLAPHAAEALGEIGDESAIAPLEVALGSGEFRLRAAALKAIARFGGRASGATSKIEMLTTDWSSEVRRAAVDALRKITGRSMPDAPPPDAPVIRPTGTGWKVSRGGRAIVLTDAWNGMTPTPPAQCANLAASVNARDALYVDDTCIVACAEGEFGGALLQAGPASRGLCRFTKESGDYFRFVPAHGSYVVILGDTALARLSRGADGSWTTKLLVGLPRGLLAYGLDAAGDPVFLLRDPPAETGESSGARTDYVLRLTAAEEIVSWP